MKITMDMTPASWAEAIRLGITTLDQLAQSIGDNAELIDGCLTIEPGYRVDDGNCEVYYPEAEDHDEAALKYLHSGDRGESGAAIHLVVAVWRNAINEHGLLVRVDEQTIEVEKEADHALLIDRALREADCSPESICGPDPGVHDWTSEGEWGLDETPGLWSCGAGKIVTTQHCRVCGLHRTETMYGYQPNPGQADSVEYRMLDENEILVPVGSQRSNRKGSR